MPDKAKATYLASMWLADITPIYHISIVSVHALSALRWLLAAYPCNEARHICYESILQCAAPVLL